MDEVKARRIASGMYPDDCCADDVSVALRFVLHVLDDERRAPRDPVPPRTLAAIEAHIARVEGELDAAKRGEAFAVAHAKECDDACYAMREAAIAKVERGHQLAIDYTVDYVTMLYLALRYGHAECERLRARCAELEAALREACDEAARWGHIAVGADADMLELHDVLVATLARLRAVADGGAR